MLIYSRSCFYNVNTIANAHISLLFNAKCLTSAKSIGLRIGNKKGGKKNVNI